MMIKLTDLYNERPIYINYNRIDAVYVLNNSVCVEYGDGERYVHVTETVDEVLEAIQTKRLAETLRHEFAGLR